MIKISTVCSGIGSPEQALKMLNVPHEIGFACEIDKYARESYLANYNPGFMVNDMTKEEWIGTQYYADIFVGGIPCQAFSLAGMRKGELDPRGLLFYDFYRYVKNQQPKAFVIENVKGLLSDNNGVTFQNWVHLLGQSLNGHLNMFNHADSLMYNLHFKVLNARNYGLPQNRERIFLVGLRNDLPNNYQYPKQVKLVKKLRDILEPVVDPKYFLSDTALAYLTKDSTGGWSDRLSMLNKDTDEVAGCVTANHSKGVPYNMIEISEPGLVFLGGVCEPNRLNDGKKLSRNFKDGYRVYDANGISATINAAGCGLGGNSGLYLVDEQNEEISLKIAGQLPGTFVSRGRIYSDDGISPIIASTTGGGKPPIIHTGKRIRRLTPLECMRLQGYPDDFKKPCSETQTYKQAGNSIPVHAMAGVLQGILNIIG